MCGQGRRSEGRDITTKGASYAKGTSGVNDFSLNVIGEHVKIEYLSIKRVF